MGNSCCGPALPPESARPLRNADSQKNGGGARGGRTDTVVEMDEVSRPRIHRAGGGPTGSKHGLEQRTTALKDCSDEVRARARRGRRSRGRSCCAPLSLMRVRGCADALCAQMLLAELDHRNIRPQR